MTSTEPSERRPEGEQSEDDRREEQQVGGQRADEQHPAPHDESDLYDARPDDVAPVDWQADPAHWLPGRALPIAAGIVLLLTIVTIVICLIIWLTPPMDAVKIPVVGRA